MAQYGSRFFSTIPPTTGIYTLSLHDALPIPLGWIGDLPGALHSGGGDQSLPVRDRKSTRLNSSHVEISYAVFCLKKKTVKRHSTVTRESHRGQGQPCGPYA